MYCSYTTLQFIINCLFSDINVSRGSVATCVRCDGSFNNQFYCKFTKEYSSKEISKKQLRLDRIMAMSLWPHFFGPPWANKTRNGQIVVDKAPWWREFWRWFPASGCWWWPRRGARPSADHPGCCEYTTSPCSTSTPHRPTYNNDIAGSAPGPVLPLVGCGCWWWPHHGARPSTDHPGCCDVVNTRRRLVPTVLLTGPPSFSHSTDHASEPWSIKT